MPAVITELDVAASVDRHRYGYTRTVRIGERVVRARVRRDYYPHQSLAVAEVLAADLSWTHLLDEAPGNWWASTPAPAGDVYAVAELGAIAEGLINRAAEILAPPPADHPPVRMISDHAAAALARTRATGAPAPTHHPTAPDTPGPDAPRSGVAVQQRRMRARLARDLAATLGVHPAHVVATADPIRSHGGFPGLLLSVDDLDVDDLDHQPDDGGRARFRFVPEAGWDSIYCLLDACPSCGGEVPMAEVSVLADLGLYLEATRPSGGPHLTDPDDPGSLPVPPEEFFGDPGHRRDCPVGNTQH